MKRREFITLLGGAAAWPLAARAQQQVPVVGFLDAGSPAERTPQLTAFRKGLAEGGYHEGQNVALEFAWAEGQYKRFGELAADLVRRGVKVIAVPGSGTARLPPKAQPHRSQSCSAPLAIQPRKGWSPASIDPAATPPV
jgi:putative ABC transport system substrate-binding protein